MKWQCKKTDECTATIEMKGEASIVSSGWVSKTCGTCGKPLDEWEKIEETTEGE